MWRREASACLRGLQSAAGAGLSVFGAKGAAAISGALRWPPMPLPRKRLQHLRGTVELIVVQPGEGAVNIG
ncbi:conserved hypothetical protein [Brucella abortus bv. 4 str. 292]|uniref:Uncharacterized protein n=2 Tax=Brucella TaxID=234 RepID=Q2YIW2_BRUA2|nr:conserved hypothetical protein [Brucella abortus bv. 4 str. 292]EEX60325.1 predicted protein [Brucella abortus bv. 2 str. 86/8/59]EEX63341.1 conserved hypothetical protein [Brucella abortus bv. 6 str. 870]EEX89085.1 predicted protein [Brucella ceti M13/05/1]EEX96488.1 predicted protein [Brucella ceti M644/93/1]EEY25009.1 conserved hypothetical protein [Brucella sp. F5/99]EEY31466.1 conserved hypothetical protein [Brucella suis bv. 3 str. 686]EFH32607.1 hypothetical protein BAYG_02122 [Bru